MPRKAEEGGGAGGSWIRERTIRGGVVLARPCSRSGLFAIVFQLALAVVRGHVHQDRYIRRRHAGYKAFKAGTKVRGIRLADGDHDIDCRVDGFGAMALKSEFVKKA